MFLSTPLSVRVTLMTLVVVFSVILVAAISVSPIPPQPPPSIVRTQPAKAAAAGTPCRAWMCSGESNRALINNLSKGGIIKSSEVKQALLSVDRANYIAPLWTESAYDDAPLSIGHGQTISAPHMHSAAMEELLPAIKAAANNKDTPVRILDVGSGSGYLSVAFGRLLGVLGITGGKVYGIDVVPELVDTSLQNVKKQDGELLSSGKVSIRLGDGWRGLPSEGPFTAIHVGAGADTLPKDLCNQLAKGGRMVIPVETNAGYQSFYRIDRVGVSSDGNFHENDFVMKELFPVRYVPLVHER